MEPVVSLEDLPYTLNADQVAAVLGIGRSSAYILMHSADFPTIRIGKRLLVARDRLAEWMDKQAK